MLDIGADLGVSESRVSQMRSEALALIKTAMASSLDREAAAPAGRSSPRLRRYVAAVATHRTYIARLPSRPLDPQPA